MRGVSSPPTDNVLFKPSFMPKSKVALVIPNCNSKGLLPEWVAYVGEYLIG